MSLGGFLEGFHQAFGGSGGYQAVGSYLNRNIGEYNPYQDPQFLQDYQIAQETGTPAARQQVAERYSEHLDIPEDTEAVDYMFSPAEGTPQAIEHQMAQLALDEAETQMEYLPDQLALGLERDQFQFGLQQEMAPYQMEEIQQQLAAGDLSLEEAQQQLDQITLQTELMEEYLPQQYEHEERLRDLQLEEAQQALEMGDLQLAINEFEFSQLQERAPQELELLQQQVEQGELTTEQLAEELDFLKFRYGLDRQYLPQQYEYEAQQHSPFAQYEPLMIAQAAIEGDSPEMWEQTPFGEHMGAQQFIDAFMGMQEFETSGQATGDEGFSPDLSDLAGQTPEGYPVYGTTRGGYYIYDETGQPQVYTGEVQTVPEDEVVEDAGFILYSHPLVPDQVAQRYSGQEMPLIEVNRLIDSLTPDYDVGEMYSRNLFDEIFGGVDRTYEDYEDDILGRETQQPNYQDIGPTTAEVFVGNIRENQQMVENAAQIYINQYGEQYSNEQIAQMLENLSPEQKIQHEQQYGIRVEEIAEYLRAGE